MSKKMKLPLLFFMLFLGLVLPMLALAQNQVPARIEINHVAPVEGNDSMAISVFFTAVDANGRPIRDPNLEGDATITLLTGETRSFPAIISDPQSPIYISLVIDTSGSMRGALDSVLVAAQSAIDSKPANALVSVIAFNEGFQVVQDFTSDPVLIRDAINRVAIPPQDLGTCLYDTLFDAINILDGRIQSAEERRAIILFTDGQDQLRRGDPTPCSTRHTLQSMLNRAIELNTPIHTIGLTTAGDTSIDAGELRNIAAETRGFSAIGTQTELGALFQEIMDGLNSQLVAQANILPPAGANSATLIVNSRNAIVEPASFTFISNTNYDLPPPPVRVLITGPTYDGSTNTYQFLFSVEGAESISELRLEIEDSGGLLVFDDIIPSPSTTETYLLSGADFTPNDEYILKIQALNQDGFLIETEDDEVVLSEKPFRHSPPEALPVEFAIESVNPFYAQEVLVVTLSVDGEVESYSGFIVDEETGERVFNFPEAPFVSADIEVPLPELMREQEPGTEIDYVVTIYLYSSSGTRFEATYDFTPQPPPPPSLGERIMAAFRTYPVVPISIFVLLLVVIGFFMFRSRRNKAQEVVIPRPPVDRTQVFSAPPAINPIDNSNPDEWMNEDIDADFMTPGSGSGQPSAPRLNLQVLRTPNTNQPLTAAVMKFPFRIGREGCDFNITGDRRISRQHVEFTEFNGQLFVADMGSTNKTFLNGEQLQPNSPTPLTGPADLRLGSQTQISIEM